jgi:hypothetical protein
LDLNFQFAKVRNEKLLIILYNPKKKKVELIDAITVSSKIIVFANEFDEKFALLHKELMARTKNRIEKVAPDKFDYIVPNTLSMFNPVS